MVKNLLVSFIIILLVSCGNTSRKKSDTVVLDAVESETAVELTEENNDYQFLKCKCLMVAL